MSHELSRVLVSGAAGFLGQALLQVLNDAGIGVRAFDIAPVQGPLAERVESVVGDVADETTVAQACADCDAMIIAHMAPNRPEVYAAVGKPFDINVKGTASLFEGAVAAGIKKVVLISSIGVVDGHRRTAQKLTLDLPPLPTNLYCLTKALQEEIARYYHTQHGLSVIMLRPAYVTDADNLTDKYKRRRPSVNWQFVDRRDVAGAALAALQPAAPAFGCYYVHGHPSARQRMEVEPTLRDLHWSPRFDFSEYPEDAPSE